jgi:predicted RNase H-like nuclease
MRRRPGPDLPYRPLAGVVPCPGGWVALTGKLHGITLTVDGAELIPRFGEVLEHQPRFDLIALGAPVGLPGRPTPGGRGCDREARALLGWPRAGAIMSAPPRSILRSRTYEAARRKHPSLSPVEYAQLGHVAEVAAAVLPFHQRTVSEVHPELSFFQLNRERPLQHGKRGPEGRAERRALLEPQLPGLATALDRRLPGCSIEHRIDAAACLWTARRIASRGVRRVPQDPEWDDEGLRMEIVR